MTVKTNTIIIANPDHFSKSESDTITKLNELRNDLKGYFKEREEIIESLFICLLSRNHAVMIGPPGTSKSYLISCFCNAIEGYNYFEWQVTKFSTPEELFGPYSLSELKKDRYKRNTEGKLPESQIAYIDEVFNANSSILNSLNSIMNERFFEGKPVPMECMFGATNFIPEESILNAFFDRFLFHFMVDKINEEINFKSMLISGEYPSKDYGITCDDITELQGKIHGVSIDSIIDHLVKLWQNLRIDRIDVSDRRFKWCLNALRARAILDGRMNCTEEDLYILKNILWSDKKEIPQIENILMKSINPIAAQIKELYDQAVDIEKQLAPLDPDADNDQMNQVREGTAKLKVIADKIDSIIKDNIVTDQFSQMTQKITRKIRTIHKKILKDKLGVSV